MAEAKKQSAPKSMDVSRPGTTTPSTSSKPIIVSNKPTVSDPVINQEEKKETTLVSHAGLTLQPLESTEKPAEVPAAKPESAPDPEPVSSDEGEVDVLAETATDKTKKKDAEKAELEVLRHVEKLADQKTYFVKTSDGASGSPFFKVLVVLIVLVLLAAVIINFLADAQVVQLPIEPVTNLL